MGMLTDEIIERVLAERIWQDAKWGREFDGRPAQQWLAILMEEVGEAAQEALQARPHPFFGLHADADKQLEAEVIQIAAVCFKWLEFRTPFAGQIRSDVVGEAPDGTTD